MRSSNTAPDDRESFDAEALTHFDSVNRVARLLTHNPSDAEDLVQETYSRALRASHRFTWGTNLRAWLLTILRNVHLNRLRDAARERATVEVNSREVDRLAGVLEDGESPEGLLLGKALDLEVRAALGALPKALRETLWLRDVENLPYAEVAERLRIPIGTVMSRIFRARHLLYKDLTGRTDSVT